MVTVINLKQGRPSYSLYDQLIAIIAECFNILIIFTRYFLRSTCVRHCVSSGKIRSRTSRGSHGSWGDRKHIEEVPQADMCQMKTCRILIQMLSAWPWIEKVNSKCWLFVSLPSSHLPMLGLWDGALFAPCFSLQTLAVWVAEGFVVSSDCRLGAGALGCCLQKCWSRQPLLCAASQNPILHCGFSLASAAWNVPASVLKHKSSVACWGQADQSSDCHRCSLFIFLVCSRYHG